MNEVNIKCIELEKKVKRNSYLIRAEEELILIDPGAKHHFNILKEGLKDYCEIKDINYIILQSNDYLNITSLELLSDEGFNGVLIVNEAGFPYLADSLKSKLKTISDLDYRLMLKNNEIIDFITSPFLPFPEAFMTYFRENQVLFSGHLVSQDNIEIINQDSLFKAVNSFHEMVLPSVEFIRHSVQKIKRLKLKTIYPRLGLPIKEREILPILSEISKYDFYNTKQIVENKNNKNVSYNYMAIINHMLRWLETRYEREEILEVFDNSAIQLTTYPLLEIENTDLSGYKLWNYFFEIIYNKKDIQWLALIEPIVRKYNRLYNINMPAIYKTKFLQQQKQINQLNVEKSKLNETIENLQVKIKETTDDLLRCPITGLYNQNFMINYLQKNLHKELKAGMTRVLILIQIDNLLMINNKYGPAKGDETIKHLAYIVNRIKADSTMIFKQNGPGIFIYKQDILPTQAQELLNKLSNEVNEAEIFIEPITFSASFVSYDELNPNYSYTDQLNQMIDLCLARLERAKQKGKGIILSKDNDTNLYQEGVILLVDEDETYQNLMMKIFKRINYEAIIAKDIYEGYEILETKKVDIIVSEINLSKLDGFQFKQKINLEKKHANIPFIIASHHKNLDVITRANLLEVDLVMQKPIIPEELIGHIKRFRERRTKV